MSTVGGSNFVNMNVDVDIDFGHVVASRVDVASTFAESLHRYMEVVNFHGGGEYRARHEEVFRPVYFDTSGRITAAPLPIGTGACPSSGDAVAWFTSVGPLEYPHSAVGRGLRPMRPRFRQ